MAKWIKINTNLKIDHYINLSKMGIVRICEKKGFDKEIWVYINGKKEEIVVNKDFHEHVTEEEFNRIKKAILEVINA